MSDRGGRGGNRSRGGRNNNNTEKTKGLKDLRAVIIKELRKRKGSAPVDDIVLFSKTKAAMEEQWADLVSFVCDADNSAFFAYDPDTTVITLLDWTKGDARGGGGRGGNGGRSGNGGNLGSGGNGGGHGGNPNTHAATASEATAAASADEGSEELAQRLYMTRLFAAMNNRIVSHLVSQGGSAPSEAVEAVLTTEMQGALLNLETTLEAFVRSQAQSPDALLRIDGGVISLVDRKAVPTGESLLPTPDGASSGGGDGRGGRLQQAGTSGVAGASPPMPFSDIVDWLLEHGRSSVVDVSQRFGDEQARKVLDNPLVFDLREDGTVAVKNLVMVVIEEQKMVNGLVANMRQMQAQLQGLQRHILQKDAEMNALKTNYQAQLLAMQNFMQSNAAATAASAGTNGGGGAASAGPIGTSGQGRGGQGRSGGR